MFPAIFGAVQCLRPQFRRILAQFTDFCRLCGSLALYRWNFLRNVRIVAAGLEFPLVRLLHWRWRCICMRIGFAGLFKMFCALGLWSHSHGIASKFGLMLSCIVAPAVMPKVEKKAGERNQFIARGVLAFSKSTNQDKTGRWRFAGKGGVKKATKPAAKAAPKARFYPVDVPPQPLRRLFKPKTAKLRSSITPGTVLIVLAGRFMGKRVVFLKQLTSGLLLVTGACPQWIAWNCSRGLGGRARVLAMLRLR